MDKLAGREASRYGPWVDAATLEIHPEVNVAHNRYQGVVGHHEVVRSVRAALDRLDPERYRVVVNDYTDATHAGTSPQDVRRTADEARKAPARRDPVMLLAIAPGDLEYGIARMWLSYAEGLKWDAAVVRTRQEAEELLSARGVDVGLG